MKMNQNNITEIYNSNFNNVNFQTSKILNTDFIFITDLELSMFSNLIYNKTGIKYILNRINGLTRLDETRRDDCHCRSLKSFINH